MLWYSASPHFLYHSSLYSHTDYMKVKSWTLSRKCRDKGNVLWKKQSTDPKSKLTIDFWQIQIVSATFNSNSIVRNMHRWILSILLNNQQTCTYIAHPQEMDSLFVFSHNPSNPSWGSHSPPPPPIWFTTSSSLCTHTVRVKCVT